ncbi:hypothetical protein CSPX01_08049 [Colletotrichum filicis]|nr:hypothetical protein CSPX01_08049 [Colletotrichum filicis]
MVGWCAFSWADLHPPGNAHARDGGDLFQDVFKSLELSLHCNGSETRSYLNARDVLPKQSLNFGIDCLRVGEGGLARMEGRFCIRKCEWRAIHAVRHLGCLATTTRVPKSGDTWEPSRYESESVRAVKRRAK